MIEPYNYGNQDKQLDDNGYNGKSQSVKDNMQQLHQINSLSLESSL